MSVRIVDGIGRGIECKWCNHYITLSSKTNYTKCENCGGLYTEPEKIVIKPVYGFYYRLYQLSILLEALSIMPFVFGFTLWRNIICSYLFN